MRTAIIGLGITGFSCVKHLHGRDDLVVVDSRDEPPFLDEVRARFPEVELHLGVQTYAFDSVNRAIVSPGIALHSCLVKAAHGKVDLLSDIDLFCDVISQPVIAITGTNGKSTVTSLVGHLSRHAGRKTAVGGNLGEPALDLIDDAAAGYVIELSSFQLERLAPHDFCSAAILNLSEDHLDRHGDMAAYIASKQRIYRNCELAVAYREDARTSPVTEVARLVTFGIDEPAQDQWGVRISAGARYLACGEELVIGCSELPLAGRHNELNVLAAFALLMNAGISNSELAAGVKSFSGLPHRCQRITEVAGVSYINDSKATNVGATLAALEGFAEQGAARLILIAGGDGKGVDFRPLRQPVERYVKAVVLLGRDAKKIADALDDSTAVHHVADMSQAVARAAEIATAGDLVLLSPACASLDMYENFAARGDEFARYAKGLAA